jgi:hypothetical protein
MLILIIFNTIAKTGDLIFLRKKGQDLNHSHALLHTALLPQPPRAASSVQARRVASSPMRAPSSTPLYFILSPIRSCRGGPSSHMISWSRPPHAAPTLYRGGGVGGIK